MAKYYPKAIPGEQRWVDYDEETGLWCIFGNESGHAYSSHTSREQAEDALDNNTKADTIPS